MPRHETRGIPHALQTGNNDTDDRNPDLTDRQVDDDGFSKSDRGEAFEFPGYVVLDIAPIMGRGGRERASGGMSHDGTGAGDLLPIAASTVEREAQVVSAPCDHRKSSLRCLSQCSDESDLLRWVTARATNHPERAPGIRIVIEDLADEGGNAYVACDLPDCDVDGRRGKPAERPSTRIVIDGLQVDSSLELLLTAVELP